MADLDVISKIKNMTPGDVAGHIESQFFTPEAIRNIQALGVDETQMRKFMLRIGESVTNMSVDQLQRLTMYGKNFKDDDDNAAVDNVPGTPSRVDLEEFMREAIPSDVFQAMLDLDPTMLTPDRK